MINIKIVDYHVHSNNSFDGKASVEEMCEEAIRKGLYEICFTEHFSIDPEDASFGVLDCKKYSEEIFRAVKKYSGKLLIKKGIEVGEPHVEKYKKEIEILLKNMDLDFIIGSVHNMNSIKLRDFMTGMGKTQFYQAYFEEIYIMAETSDIDVVGHLDLPKRYVLHELGNYDFESHREIFEKILNKIIEREIGLEINCSGLVDEVNETYPKFEVLRLYKKLGGEIITISSDAHTCENLALNNLRIMRELKKTGFEKIFTFEKRKKIPLEINF